MTTANPHPQLQPDKLARSFFIITMIAALMFYGVSLLLSKVLPSEDPNQEVTPSVTVP